MPKDYYKILGVDRNASREEIKRAYKKLAKKYHPDRYQDEAQKKEAEAKFKEINEAAAVLGDEQKRAKYDRFGTAQGVNFSDFNFRDFGFNMGEEFDFGDIFDMFFGGGFSRSRRRSYRGSDLRFNLELSLNEVAEGVEKTIILPRHETCDKCNGKGAEHDSDIITCHKCGGNGRTTSARRTPFGLFQTTSTCDACHGEGKAIKKPCPKCRGEGRIQNNSRIKVKIPAGVEEGTRLRISGEGEAGEKGGPPGDLYVIIHIKPHKWFQRKGDDLYCEIPISFAQAALGDIVEVPTLKSKTRLKIPSGTQTHTLFKLKNRGIPHLNSYGRGDQLVRVIVETPTKLSKKQKSLLEEFDKVSGEKPLKNFFRNLFDKI